VRTLDGQAEVGRQSDGRDGSRPFYARRIGVKYKTFANDMATSEGMA
jgi:hypothetical protein